MNAQRFLVGVVWFVLLGINVIQVAASLVSEPFLPLRPDDFQLRDATGAIVATTSPLVSVWIRYDLFAPLPVGWVGTATVICALLVMASRTDSARGVTPQSASDARN